MTDRYSIVNGNFLPSSQACVSVNDMAIQRGYGVFDFFRTLRGKPVFWNEHIERLECSCKAMRLPLPGRDVLFGQLNELVRRNAIEDSGIRITVTAGEPADGYSVGNPNILIVQNPLKVNSYPPPIRLITHEHRRQLPHVKTIDYLMAVQLRPVVVERGADEVLYHQDGRISECPRANVFIVRDGVLATPARDVLAGVTRRHVIALAGAVADVQERDVALAELRSADEVFITATSRMIVPVTHVDGDAIGGGQPGALTKELMRRFAEHVEQSL